MGSFRGYWEGRLQLLLVFFAVLTEFRDMKVLVRPVAGPTNLETVYENECGGPSWDGQLLVFFVVSNVEVMKKSVLVAASSPNHGTPSHF